MSDEDERVSVTTYVPAYERSRWREDADRLDMSQSEFVRTMVQAGRRGFDLDGSAGGEARTPAEPRDRDATAGGDGLKTRIEAILRERGGAEWDELLAALTEDVEERVEEALSALQDDNRVKHRARNGGYVLVGDSDGE